MMKYLEKGSYLGNSFGVLTNITQQPDILVIGPIAAKDLCLFPATNKNLDEYIKITNKIPEIVSTSKGKFLISNAQGGGAAQYIIEQLPFYTPKNYSIGLFSLVGNNPALPEMIEHLEKLKIQYYILHFFDIPSSRFVGTILPSGHRYWSRMLHHPGPMELFHPKLMPSEFIQSDLAIITSLPPLVSCLFSNALKGLIAGQIFEHYFTTQNHSSLNNLINDIWPNRCAFLNINENELVLISKFLGFWDDYSKDKIGSKLQRGLDSLMKTLSGTANFVGLGEHGMHLGYNSGLNKYNYYLPAIPSDCVFDLGAGDTAFASALGKIMQILNKKKMTIKELKVAMKIFTLNEWSEVARSFIEGGFVGVRIVDAFTTLEYRKQMIEIAKIKSKNLNILENHLLNQVEDIKISKNELKDQLQQGFIDNELERVLQHAFNE